MNILISNDDGIEAAGIQALVELVERYGQPIVFAPATERSGSGHQVTVDRPLTVHQLGDYRYAVDGTPADCIRIAMTEFDFDFGLVVSGINSGGNLGVDVFMSGTAAAAREASYFGVESIAISQYRNRNYVADWERSKILAQRGIEFARSRDDDEPGFWNINLPSLEKVSPTGQEVPLRLCKLDRNPHQVAYRKEQNKLLYDGVYQNRPRDNASDVELCFGGAVTLTRCI